MNDRDVKANPTNRHGRYKDNREYAGFVRRSVRAYGRRVADGDVEALAEMLQLARELDAAIDNAVDGLRAHGYSWSEIGERAGITKQTAHERWAKR